MPVTATHADTFAERGRPTLRRNQIGVRSGSPSGRLLNPRHEAFCRSLAAGDMSAGKAYQNTYPLSRSYETDGPRLLRNAQIQERIAEIQAARAEESEFKVQSAIAIMRRIAESPLAKDSDRISACRAVGVWCGWEKGTQAANKLADNPLDSLIARIRARRSEGVGPTAPGDLSTASGIEPRG